MFIRPQFKIKAGSHQIKLGQKTKLMAIVNLTADSFSRDGLLKKNKNVPKLSLNRVQQFIKDGADIIDVGGESSRPGAISISEKEEIDRIIPTILLLAKKIKIPISVDTYKPVVAQHALDAGATIVNNIMGTKLDKSLLRMVKNYNAAIILMHIKGTPKTMQKKIYYRNVIKEIIESLRKSKEICLDLGIKSDRIIVDPGIGFGKSLQHNLKIIHHLKDLKLLKQPILIGTSRKSFIGKILNNDVNDRLIGSVASICSSIINGVHIVRVHDVKATKQAIQITDAILNKNI